MSVEEVVDAPQAADEAVLQAEDVHVSYSLPSEKWGTRKRIVRALRGVSLTVPPGKTIGVVGESGCGKSTLGRLLVGLEAPESGTVFLRGQDVAQVHGKRRDALLRRAQMVFQSPFTSLDPRMTVHKIIREPMDIAKAPEARQERNKRTVALMESVGLPRFLGDRRPGALSGGQQQRVGLARALAAEPEVVICDEPVSSLDVAIQAQVINLLRDIQRDLGVAYVFIAHDLGVVATISDYVAVMYLGQVIEYGATDQVYGHPQHPFTRALMSFVPVADIESEMRDKRVVLEGELPSPENIPSGCPFRTRCWKAQEVCEREDPSLSERGANKGHQVACHFPE